jgi:hypothetical protein
LDIMMADDGARRARLSKFSRAIFMIQAVVIVIWPAGQCISRRCFAS